MANGFWFDNDYTATLTTLNLGPIHCNMIIFLYLYVLKIYMVLIISHYKLFFSYFELQLQHNVWLTFYYYDRFFRLLEYPCPVGAAGLH